ncbi:hydrogenase maturation nickel metallochaperone HypA [Kaistella sp. 97-N-M2]|uniref:hydrogenase maturation nickel metallochaperone HypA n=1 Tax=Kaistella sp. 97-N-M2 TaxID=2908645 RepID=UPI001F2FABB9|nr:hydrogenase maturation nickel metallochaperone HypA [Kaistella sp. 97-N-M2]UJF29877.1 hydrogenase maturation nickel metallochaperone HypA [Kaistella sp. 97-N-M2]
MKLTLTERRNFISSWLKLKPKPKEEPKTVLSVAKSLGLGSNHEVWRTCNSCGNHFDVRIELKFICPDCGSVDLRIG